LSCISAPVIAFVGCIHLIGHYNFVPVFAMTTGVIVIESMRLMVSDIFAASGRVGASVATMHYIRSLLVLPSVGIVVAVVHRPSLVIVLAAFLSVAALQFAAALVHARHDVAYFGASAKNSELRNAMGQGT